MTSLRLYLEGIEEHSILHALNLPGCYSEGMSEDEALRRFPLAWASYADWLISHGEVTPERTERFVITERFASYVLPDGYEVNAFFAPERRPPSRCLIARCQRLLSYSRADLLATWQAMPANRRDSALVDGQRTPQQIINHVARAEWWYLSHLTQLTEGPIVNPLSGWLGQLAGVRAALVDWLDTASDKELQILSVVEEEEWSVRKVLRRALWHERTHTAELARYVEQQGAR